MTICRSAAMLVVAALVASVVAAGCETDRGPTVDAEPRGRASVYVSLGGDDAYGGRAGLVTAWPQVLFRSELPITTEFVNLAGRRAGIAEVRREQVETATTLMPDLVTITVVDDAERGTDPGSFGADLDAVVRRLREGTEARVLIGTVPPDVTTPDVVEGLNQEVERVARASGATVVDLGAVSSQDPALRGQQIAAAFAAKLAGAR